jgi:hypothetical protein
MLVKAYGSAVYGVDAFIITIEVDVGQGTQFFMVDCLIRPLKKVNSGWRQQLNFITTTCPDRILW